MSTARQIITAALEKLNVSSANSVPTDQDIQIGLSALNSMIDSKSNDFLNIHQIQIRRFPLTPGQQVYSLGPTGDWQTERPMRMEKARLMMNPVFPTPPPPALPVINNATTTSVTYDSALVGASTLTAEGRLYAAVTTSSTPPTAEQIITGTGFAAAGNQVVTTTGARTLAVSSLVAATTYYHYHVQRVPWGNSNVLSSAPFVTGLAPPPPDPYYDDVSLLLHCDGTQGSTLLIDSSQYLQNRELLLNSELTTAEKKFGTASISILKQEYGLPSTPWVGPQFSRAPNEPLTIEHWFQWFSNSLDATTAPRLWSLYYGTNPANTAITLDKYGDNNTLAIRVGTGEAPTLVSFPAAEWVHIAVTVDASNVFTLWINGQSAYTTTMLFDSEGLDGTFQMGENGTTEAVCNCYLDELRYTKGVARYTAPFTPPTQPFYPAPPPAPPAPAPVLTSPTTTNIGTTTATVGATTDTGAGTLYAAVTTSAVPPTSAAIIAGTGFAGAGNQVVTTTGAKQIAITGLQSATTYYHHMVQSGAPAGISNVQTSPSFTTLAVPAPVLISPTTTNIGTTTATIGATTNTGAGTLYAAVTTSSTPPTAEQIITGTGFVAAGNQVVTTSGAKTLAITGLSPSTAYYHYHVQTAPNGTSNVLSSAPFITATPVGPKPTFIGYAGQDTTGQTITIPTHAAGDAILVWLRGDPDNSGGGQPPTPEPVTPYGWITATGASSNYGAGLRILFTIDTNNTFLTVPASWARQVAVYVYRNASYVTALSTTENHIFAVPPAPSLGGFVMPGLIATPPGNSSFACGVSVTNDCGIGSYTGLTLTGENTLSGYPEGNFTNYTTDLARIDNVYVPRTTNTDTYVITWGVELQGPSG